MLDQIKLTTRTSSGTLTRVAATVEYRAGRIFFLKSPFTLKDEIKAMKGSRWHGYDEEEPRKIWSVDDCQRNRFQLEYLKGEDVYAWFDRPLVRHKYREYQRAGKPAEVMPHQFDLADAGLTYHYQIFAAEMGTGKGGLPSTRVATPTGWITLGEVCVGDAVINPDGGVTRVRGVYRRGRMGMFRVTFSDGATTVCSGDHLWNVRSACQKHRGESYRTLPLREIVAHGLCRANGNAMHYIPMVEPVEYAAQPLLVDPYLAGYILGNGGLTGYTNVISIPDQETVDRLNALMTQPLLAKKNSDCDYHVKDKTVNAWIVADDLRGRLSPEKHVPAPFLYNNVENRVKLLQGLCDSDGSPCHAGGVEYSTTSPDLRDAFVTLVQSLGGTCAVAEKYPTYTYKGEQHTGRLAFRINASFPASVRPFRLARKTDLYVTPTKYQPTRAIVAVASIADAECICIEVEATNQLYVTDEYIVTHNTLSAQMVMEESGKPLWYWAGPKTSLPNIKRELKLWGFPSSIQVEFFTYEGLVRVTDEWDGSQPVPFGFIADESSRCKNTTSQRSRACQKLADLIRTTHGLENGYVLEMSGTPSPKTPVDWYSQAEIAWPGFLKEGSPKAMEERLAFMVEAQFDAGPFKKRIGWKDDEKKCVTCGKTLDEGPHALDECADPDTYHAYKPSKNEVAYLYERLKGLAIIKHKKDCLTLPDKRYRRIVCKPTPSTLRVAQSITNSAPNAITGMTLLRELSDGFIYREVQDGVSKCTHCKDGTGVEWSSPDEPDKIYTDVSFLDPELVAKLVKQNVLCPACGGAQEVPKIVRVARECPTPKEAALKMLLDENEETGRLVVFAGFTGSVDRIVKLCLREKWDVVRCDQGNFQVFAATSDSVEGQLVTGEEPLDYWANLANHGKVAFVANPESGGMSLTLVEARMAVYWSNSWKSEYRIQSEDRIHRIGADFNKGCTIVDLIHLPSDERVLRVLRANRKLELMSMGEIMAGVNWEDASEDGDMLVEEAVA